MTNHPQVVVLNGNLYVGGGYTSQNEDAATILEFICSESPLKWRKLPQCNVKDFGLAAVSDKLVTVGGTDIVSYKKSNEIFQLVPGAQVVKWEKSEFPPLQESRSNPYTVTYKKWLVVIGGDGESGMLNTVVKLNTSVNESAWLNCPPFPVKVSEMSAAIVDNKLYVFGNTVSSSMGGINSQSKSVFCATPDLLVSAPVELQSVWTQLPDVPLKASTALSAVLPRSELFAVGGIEKSTQRASRNVYYYKPDSKEWCKYCDLPKAVYQCACIQLPGDYRILIIGGSTGHTCKGAAILCVKFYDY